MSTRVCVVLSGCGFRDGAEIHESVLTLLSLDRAGADVSCFAPNIPVSTVVNHLTGEAVSEPRNVLVESARIARGEIRDVSEAKADDFDAIVLPGGFGAGKTILQEALAKWCDADIIVYVGCGERGNEMAEVLDEFPQLEDPRTGRPLMERTVIIANTSNMPVAAREASIYTAITVAEYFRDRGLHVALMADSTSRWAEALREISGRLGELPSESGYPAYLSARLADFYERAARVETLSGEQASVTIIGAISPPAGDFSEPVTTHTKRYVRCFWGLDRDRAQARFYPAINPLLSYSEEADILAPWWREQGNADWSSHRQRLLTLLEEQARLERMARIVGKDALPPGQQLTLLNADLVNDGFLRQSAFSEVDRYCSPQRQTAMLRLLVHFTELAERAVADGITPDIIAALPIVRRLQRLGEEVGEDDLEQMEVLWEHLEIAFADLRGEH